MGLTHNKGMSRETKYKHLQKTAWKYLKDRNFDDLSASEIYAIDEAYEVQHKLDQEAKLKKKSFKDKVVGFVKRMVSKNEPEV